MTLFQRERVHGLWPELTPLLEQHWREIAHFDDIPLSPDQKKYELMEDVGLLRIFTARREGVLIGYAVYLVTHSMHYSTSKHAVQDVLWLHPDYRNGKAGVGLLRHVQAALKAEEVQVDVHHVKAKHPQLGNILMRMGYELVDLIYIKRLDKE